MTIPMDTALSFTAGHVFAIAAQESIEQGNEEEEKVCAWRARLFTALVVVPIGLYFLWRWPDWSYMYFNGRYSRSRVLGALGLSCYIVAGELGYQNASRLIKSGNKVAAHASTVAAAMMTVLITLLGFDRLRWIGTIEDYRAGTAKDAFLKPGFHLALIGSGALVVPLAIHVIACNSGAGPKL